MLPLLRLLLGLFDHILGERLKLMLKLRFLLLVEARGGLLEIGEEVNLFELIERLRGFYCDLFDTFSLLFLAQCAVVMVELVNLFVLP